MSAELARDDGFRRRLRTDVGLIARPLDYDARRDLWRVLITGDGLPAICEVAPGGYPIEADLRFVVNALDQSIVVFAVETHDAMSPD